MGGKSTPSVNYGTGDSDLPRPMYREPTQNNASYRPQSLANYERSVAPDNLGYGQYWDRGPASTSFYNPGYAPQYFPQQQGQASGKGAMALPQQPVPQYQPPQQQPYQPYQPPQQNTARQPDPFEQLPTGTQAPAQATIQGVQYGQLPGMAGAAEQAPSQGIGRRDFSSSQFDDWSRR